MHLAEVVRFMKWEYFLINISNNKGKIGNQISQDSINNHSYSTFKENNLLGKGSLGELIIDK